MWLSACVGYGSRGGSWLGQIFANSLLFSSLDSPCQTGNMDAQETPASWPFSVEVSVKQSANLIQRGEWIKMANLVGTSNNDQPAVSGENTVTMDQILQSAVAQDKSILDMGSGAGIQGKGLVGVEGIGSERGIVARGKIGILCQGDDTSVSALTGNGVAIRGASVNGVGLEISGGRVAARFTGKVEINGDLD